MLQRTHRSLFWNMNVSLHEGCSGAALQEVLPLTIPHIENSAESKLNASQVTDMNAGHS
jgi:hypothetical protein